MIFFLILTLILALLLLPVSGRYSIVKSKKRLSAEYWPDLIPLLRLCAQLPFHQKIKDRIVPGWARQLVLNGRLHNGNAEGRAFISSSILERLTDFLRDKQRPLVARLAGFLNSKSKITNMDFSRFHFSAKRNSTDPEKALFPTIIFINVSHPSFDDITDERIKGFMLCFGWWDFSIKFGCFFRT